MWGQGTLSFPPTLTKLQGSNNAPLSPITNLFASLKKKEYAALGRGSGNILLERQHLKLSKAKRLKFIFFVTFYFLEMFVSL